MNSDLVTFGDSTWSTQTVNDRMYACSAGECSNSSEIKETTGRPVIWPVNPCEITGELTGDQPGSAGPSKPKRPSRSKELVVNC
jgi:hypothetical protein